MLVLVAFDLSWSRGIPADVARVGGSLASLVRHAEAGEHHGRRPSAYEVCEVWELLEGQRPRRVARRQPGFLWLDADGHLLTDVRQWAFEADGTLTVEPLPDRLLDEA